MKYNIDILAEALTGEGLAFNLLDGGEGTIEYKDIIWYAPAADGVNEQTDKATITETKCNSLYTAKLDTHNSLEYSRKREEVYPSIQDQLDMQYWDGVNGTTTWKDAIAKVKSDNPKE